MLSISSGHGADYLLGAVASGRENYYTGAVADGEPPGQWRGEGAAKLGLVGEVDEQDMTAVYERFIDPRDARFQDPEQWDEAETLGHAGRRYRTADEAYTQLLAAEPDATPERREELRAEAGRSVRRNVAFFDLTFSPQKSVTVLHSAFEAQEIKERDAGNEEAAAAWAVYRRTVEDALWQGNQAMLEYMSRNAGYSRVGHHGGQAGRFVDAHDFTVASFFQHDSRNHDPQLHIHNAVLNRVEGTDGEWRTLDSRGLHKVRAAGGTIGERTMEEYLSRLLGVRFAARADGEAREIVGISQDTLDLMSSRRRRITAKAEELVAAFRIKNGRDPSSLELDRLKREATFATRKSKSHQGETTAQRLERVESQIQAELTVGFDGIAEHVLSLAATAPASGSFSPNAVKQAALAQVQQTQATWTRAHLSRAISSQLPDYLGGLDGAEVAAVIDRLTEQALADAVPVTAPGPGADVLPDALRLGDGRSAYDRPGGAMYATADQLRAEQALVEATRDRSGTRVDTATAQRYVDQLAAEGIQLGEDQRAAVVGMLTSGARVGTLIGPAGAGKSFVLGVLARAWQDPDLWDGRQQRVVGLATSQIAAGVLQDEGLQAYNITRWLAMQQKLAAARGACTEEELAVWQRNEGVLRPGDLVVVDESAMTSTDDLHAVRQVVEDAGAELLPTGDHHQLGAVGAGGGMALVADTGSRHELTDVRRFTADWEGEASLRLRVGDRDVLTEYRKHGRIIDAGTTEAAEQQASRAYLADLLDDRDTVLIVDSNEQAERLGSEVRAELVRLGRVSETGVALGRDGNIAGVGDLVQTRHNGWDLTGYEGNAKAPINRERYTVAETRDDGSLVVDQLGTGTRLVLDADYVREHLTLGYASTAHAVQGLTVDTSHSLASSSSTPAAVYVPMTRGRDRNTSYVVTHHVRTDVEPGEGQQVERHDPSHVLDAVLQTADEPERSATAEAAHSAAEMASAQTVLERYADGAGLAGEARTARHLDQLTADGVLSPSERQRLAASEAMPVLATTLRRAELAGHDPYTTLQHAITRTDLGGSHDLARVLNGRITSAAGDDGLTPASTVEVRYDAWTPTDVGPQWEKHFTELARAGEARRDELASEIAADPPPWAVAALGEAPDDKQDADARTAWAKQAATVAMHRELVGHDDAELALPGAPSVHQPETYASWSAAWTALGRPEAARDETSMSPGQLYARVRAWEREKNWQPAYVAQDLAGTTQAEQKHRRIATIRQAEADATTHPAEREEYREQAVEAQALADALAQQRDQLERADEIRSDWYDHTSATRTAAERASTELKARGLDMQQLQDHTTAEEWLAAYAEATLAEDEHRTISETDLAEHDPGVDAATINQPGPVAEDPGTDLRQDTADEVPQPGLAPEDDWDHVPSRSNSKRALEDAHRALHEVNRRERYDAAPSTRRNRSSASRRRPPAPIPPQRDEPRRDSGRGLSL